MEQLNFKASKIHIILIAEANTIQAYTLLSTNSISY